MKVSKALIFALSIFASAAAGQNADLEKTQQSLAKSLLKNAPRVYDVKFEGCKVMVKLSSPSNPYVSAGNSSVVGSTFPRDEASNVLSAGSGFDLVRINSTERFVLNLSNLNEEDVSVSRTYNRKISRIDIAGDETENTVSVVENGKIVPREWFRLLLKRKSGDETVELFRDAIAQCK